MSLLNSLLESAIILASPVIAGLLLSEFTLGLLSRFTPQLNAFSISLTVKSVVTFFILLIYFSPLSPDQISHFFLIKSQISFWFKAR
jgi:type III secretory pathway component EscT